MQRSQHSTGQGRASETYKDHNGKHPTAVLLATPTVCSESLTLLVLDLGLHIVISIAALHLKRDGLASEGLDENLHASAQTQHQVESRLLLDVVISQGAPVLE